MMSQLICGLFYLVLFALSGVISACENEISPPALVVRYGELALATCRSLVPIDGIGWESTVGATGLVEEVTELNWTVKELRQWTVRPQCFINPKDGEQCVKELPVVVYKMPDSVSLKDKDPSPKITGRLYTFLCNVENVAPIQNLTVRWFRGEELLSEMTKDQEIHKEPLSMSYVLEKYFSEEDDGKKYRCEAGLDFLSERPIQSQPVHITFHYPPVHKDTEVEVLKLESDTILNCTVSSNPSPVYAWTLSGTSENMGSEPILRVNQAGDYTCTASNKLGSSSKHFRVEPRSLGTFWAIIIAGAVVAVVLMVGYGIYKWRSGPNSII